AVSHPHLLSLLLSSQPRPTLFPYTTLFRSWQWRLCPGELALIPGHSLMGRRIRVQLVLHVHTPRLQKTRSMCCRLLVRACFSSRSEEHTSELQSPDHLVCRLLLEKKKLH